MSGLFAWRIVLPWGETEEAFKTCYQYAANTACSLASKSALLFLFFSLQDMRFPAVTNVPYMCVCFVWCRHRIHVQCRLRSAYKVVWVRCPSGCNCAKEGARCRKWHIFPEGKVASGVKVWNVHLVYLLMHVETDTLLISRWSCMLLCFTGLCWLGGGLCCCVCFSTTANPSDCASKLIRERRGGGNCTALTCWILFLPLWLPLIAS